MITDAASDANSGRLYLLDMGKVKYGDCILAVYPSATILIDGGHPGDYSGQSGFSSIPEQLNQILETSPPYPIDLLVVTHCHSDHIGCLPDLVANDDLKVKWALVSDETIGFGLSEDRAHSDAWTAAGDQAKRMAAALREEPHDHLSGADLAQYLSDVAKLEDRYKEMLQNLEAAGTRVVRYGKDDTSELEAAFRSVGIEILGPSQEQLEACASVIRESTDAVLQTATAAGDAVESDVSLYRRLMQGGVSDEMDRVGKGAALNDTSIVLKLGASAPVLMAGDCQFAQPEVPGVDDYMAALLEKVNQKGPYKLIKLSHHSSYNGVDEDVLAGWNRTTLFCHSGGSNDPGHPDKGTLALLKKNASRLQYARTDRNGMIVFDGRALKVTRGKLNDFSANRAAGGRDEPAAAEAAPPAFAATATGSSGVSFQTSLTIPMGDSELKWSIELKPRAGAEPPDTGGLPPVPGPIPPPIPPPKEPPEKAVLFPKLPGMLEGLLLSGLAGGRKLPKLLFVTNSNALAHNIGATECTKALDLIRSAGQTVLDLAPGRLLYPTVRKALGGSRYAGVVIVGGYDVLPSQRLDVLTPQLRTALGTQVNQDPDRFIVWSDSIYGDTTGDGLADLPVSRIPDARSSKLVMAALTASDQGVMLKRFGIRNSARPFADKVWKLITPSPSNAILVSGPTTAAQVQPADVDSPHTYFMLHGDCVDSSRFWGEVPGLVEAINVSRLPAVFHGTVFAGCCWGALTVQQTAADYSGGAIAPKTVESSIALSFLAAGATAFVGATGVHYSPDATASFFGGPMHLSFWSHKAGKKLAPAPALFQARIEYLAGMPHGHTSAMEQAIERKILMEFTCLGLGW